MEGVHVVDVSAIETLGWLEPHVVITWVEILSESPHWHREEWTDILTQSLKRGQRSML